MSNEDLAAVEMDYHFGVDDDDLSAPIDVPLSDDGKGVWIDFYNQHAADMADLTGELAACWSKLEGYAARLALIVHLIRVATDDSTVNVEAVDGASVLCGATMVKWFGNEAKRVYQTFGESEEDRDRRTLVELIERKGGSITTRDVMRSMRRFRNSAEEAERALTGLVEMRIGAWYVNETGGRPASVFRLEMR